MIGGDDLLNHEKPSWLGQIPISLRKGRTTAHRQRSPFARRERDHQPQKSTVRYRAEKRTGRKRPIVDIRFSNCPKIVFCAPMKDCTKQHFLPADELQFLLGKEIASIRFEPSGVHFVWWEGGEIHAMRDFDHIDGEGKQHHFGAGSWSDPASLLHHLIPRKVVALDVENESLMLNFDDGQKLVFFAYTGDEKNGLIQLGKDLGGVDIVDSQTA